ncbi:glycosyltransferase family 20-domain-containing protein [Paraphysoderma sedebokerense]|nr:glycosyltransferase family 20-domain-containing protein [Paraphysoderma sedebokerense]KAI9138197.1 glycosyltransferase family 20-domain-containing protein [Paraphysoderma sedebokerense]
MTPQTIPPTLSALAAQNGVPANRIILATHYLPYTVTLLGTAHQQKYPNSVINVYSHSHHFPNGHSYRDAHHHPYSNHSRSRSRNSSTFTPSSPATSPATSVSEPLTSDSSALIEDGSLDGASQASSEISFKFSTRRGHTALYSGMKSLEKVSDCIYIGYIGSVYDEDGYLIDLNKLGEEYIDAIKTQLLKEKNCIPVFLDEKIAAGHYEGYCKCVLWPLFHYILWENATDGRMEKDDWEAYQSVNQQFADIICSIYQPGDIIWIHDYHLLTMPSMLRSQLSSGAPVGLFLHTPFPSSEVFRCLPKRKEVLHGILGASLVGFQTYSYARHFISSCTRVLGLESNPTGVEYNGSMTTIGIFPIGIDVSRVERYRKSASVLQKIQTLRELYQNKKIIIGRDKLDQIKGVHQKLSAYEKFLQLYPHLASSVVLIQVTSPSPHSNPKLESKVSELVAHINGKYGSIEFTPVYHIHQHIDAEEYFALLSVADVGLITSVRDGMNTTSHEFVVCQKENEEKGVLILSEFTGTAGSLSSAILVNPWDYMGMAHSIYEALTLSKEERSLKHQQLYDHVTSHTAEFWASSFVKELKDAVKGTNVANPTPYLDIKSCLSDYQKAKRRLLMFDYDGTLTPIVKTPSAALPSPQMLRNLQLLTSDPKNTVYIISGRDQQTLETWLGSVPGVGLSAEHGCFLKKPCWVLNSKTNQLDGKDSKDGMAKYGKWENLTEEMDLSWKKEVIDIFTYYTERTQGSFIEHKRASVTWHYRLADPEYGLFQAKECQNHLENAILSKLPVEILIGKKNLEVRPVSVNKGEIVKELLLAPPDDSGAGSFEDSHLINVSRQQPLTVNPNTSHAATTTTPTSSNPVSPTSPTFQLHYDFVFCVGDDKTDEDMFKMLRKLCPEDEATEYNAAGVNNDIQVNSTNGARPSIYTATIGNPGKLTSAKWHLTSSEEVVDVMGTWVGQK